MGYTRPLEPQDLYKMDDARSAYVWAQRFSQAYESVVLETTQYNESLERGDIKPSALKRFSWNVTGNLEAKSSAWRESKRRKTDMVDVLYQVVRRRFWLALVLKVAGDTAQISAPLVTRVSVYCLESFINSSLNRLRSSSDT